LVNDESCSISSGYSLGAAVWLEPDSWIGAADRIGDVLGWFHSRR
jgi:hypothetical protein